MHDVKPKTFVIAETRLIADGWYSCLNALGAEGWASNYHSQPEGIIEFGGRLCYKSFGTELNKNLTQTREGNMEYINSILKSKHGSVLEHASTSVAMLDVSRILTHELVRHRQGMSPSQESMRFVRMDDIGMYIPDLTRPLKDCDDLSDMDKINLQEEFIDAVQAVTTLAEERIKDLNAYIPNGMAFKFKKILTSAFRRMAPGGHSTNILVTANHRAWRYMIQQRTSSGAEEEIRVVFDQIAKDFKLRYPAIYQDMYPNPVAESPIPEYLFTNEKV